MEVRRLRLGMGLFYSTFYDWNSLVWSWREGPLYEASTSCSLDFHLRAVTKFPSGLEIMGMVFGGVFRLNVFFLFSRLRF